MTTVWILTLLMANGHIHHYSDSAVYANRRDCEAVREIMDRDDTVCREIKVHQ